MRMHMRMHMHMHYQGVELRDVSNPFCPTSIWRIT